MKPATHPCIGCAHNINTVNGTYCTYLGKPTEYSTCKPCTPQ